MSVCTFVIERNRNQLARLGIGQNMYGMLWKTREPLAYVYALKSDQQIKKTMMICK